MYTTVKGFVSHVLQQKEYEGIEEIIDSQRKVVSIRLDAYQVADLMKVAQFSGLSRAACAEELLCAAVEEALEGLGIQREFGRHMQVDGDAILVKDAEGNLLASVQDDAPVASKGSK